MRGAAVARLRARRFACFTADAVLFARLNIVDGVSQDEDGEECSRTQWMTMEKESEEL